MTGLSTGRVSQLSRLKAWDNVPTRTAIVFAEACGVDFLHLARQKRFLKHCRMAHMNLRGRYFRGLLKAVSKS